MEETQSKKYYTGLIMSVVLFLISVVLFVIFLYRMRRGKRQYQTPDNEKMSDVNYMTPGDFYDLVHKQVEDELTARIITSHAMHESGVFSSRVFIEDNNAFGMHFPEKRETTAIAKDDKGFAVYENLDDSIEDLLIWFKSHDIPVEFKTPASYAAKIREYDYYTDSYAAYAAAMKIHFEALNKAI